MEISILLLILDDEWHCIIHHSMGIMDLKHCAEHQQTWQ